MEEVIKILEKWAATEPLSSNCVIKIRRSEIGAPMAYIRGKEIGARDLAVELLEVINGEA